MNYQGYLQARLWVENFGNPIIWGLFSVSLFLIGCSLINFFKKDEKWEKYSYYLVSSIVFLFVISFLLIIWYHYQIYSNIALELPESIGKMINQRIYYMNQQSPSGFPLVNWTKPPRYIIPLWIENEKLFFWALCYALFALYVNVKSKKSRFKDVSNIILSIYVAVVFFYSNPFVEPLKNFHQEIIQWSSQDIMLKANLFFKMYPRQIFYYNAFYMWTHPPLLFIGYAALTITFSACLFMLFKRDAEYERFAYNYAKLGYILLTFGMLIGYPWALEAWDSSWWWDPKISSSIMMWLMYSAFMHTRLYTYRKNMWYFTSFLGIICFLSLLFTYVTSYYFPGEHTF